MASANVGGSFGASSYRRGASTRVSPRAAEAPSALAIPKSVTVALLPATGLTGADPDGVVRRADDGEGDDGAHVLLVEDRGPVDAGIARLPDVAVGRADVDGRRIAVDILPNLRHFRRASWTLLSRIARETPPGSAYQVRAKTPGVTPTSRRKCRVR